MCAARAAQKFRAQAKPPIFPPFVHIVFADPAAVSQVRILALRTDGPVARTGVAWRLHFK